MSNIPPLCKRRTSDERSVTDAKKRKQELAKLRQQRFRAKLTPADRQARRDWDNTRKREVYALLTLEQLQARQSIRHANNGQLTPDQLQARRDADNTQHREAYALLTPEQLQTRRDTDNARRRQAYAELTPDQLQARHDADNTRHREAYAQLTPEQLQARRDRDNTRHREAYAHLTPDQVQACHDADSTKHRKAHSQLNPDQLQEQRDAYNNRHREATADIVFRRHETLSSGYSTEASPCEQPVHDLHLSNASEAVKTKLAVMGGSNASICSKHFPDDKPTTDYPNPVTVNATTVQLEKSGQSRIRHVPFPASHVTEPIDADDASNTILKSRKSLETDEICRPSTLSDSTHPVPDEDRVADNTAALDIDRNMEIPADEFTVTDDDRVTDNTGALDVDLNMEILAWHTTNT